jgi:putative transposase
MSKSAFGAGAPLPASVRVTVNATTEAGLLDEVVGKVASGQLALRGAGASSPEMIRAALEQGLAVELGEHVGYERGDGAGRGSGNSRNGTTSKPVAFTVGDLALDSSSPGGHVIPPRECPGRARLGRSRWHDRQPACGRDDGAAHRLTATAEH